MKTSDIKKLGEAWASVTSKQEELEEKKKLDPVDDAENDKKFKDRKDKDIDNDGDVDSSDEYLHKRRAATDDAIDGGKKPAKNAKKEENDEEGEEEPKKKKMPPKKDGEEKDSEDEGEESEEEEEGEEETPAPKKDDKKDDKKKVATSPKTAEISKIGEATEELIGMLESAAKQQKSNATKPEGIMDKESPKSKEFANAHAKSDKKIEDDEEDGHDKTFKAGQATKAKSGKRPQDNPAGDNKVVKSTEAPVKEDVDTNAKDGSVSLVDMARAQLAGEGMFDKFKKKKEPAMTLQQKNAIRKKKGLPPLVKKPDGRLVSMGENEKNPFDGRTKSAREFLERMAKRRGYVKKDD